MKSYFDYVAIDGQGDRVSGRVSGLSEKDVIGQLSKDNLKPVSIVAAMVNSQNGPGSRRLKDSELVVSLFELVSMLKAGVSAVDSVSSQARSAAHPRLRWGFSKAEKSLRHGASFEQAMAATEFQLPKFLFYMLKAGEASGKLAEALSDACDQMQYNLEVRNESRNALIYPFILVVTGVLAVLMMFVYVVPSFANLLEEATDLPFLAWLVLSTGRWANNNLFIVFAMLLSPPVLFSLLGANAATREMLLGMMARMPLVGEWIRQSDIASWSKVMASLLKNKVELTMALELAQESVRLPVQKRQLRKARASVKAGESIADALAAHDCLNDTGYNLVRVGEKSGQLAGMLASLGDLYTSQSQQRMKKVLLLIEPIAILIIGSAIGLIIIGIMLAITSANDIPL